MAKLLLDENLSRRLLRFLAHDFPGSAHISQFEATRRSDDRAIWRLARDHGYILVTHDADFADISALEGAPPALSWLKLGNCTNARIIAELTSRRDKIEHAIAAGDVSVLEIR